MDGVDRTHDLLEARFFTGAEVCAGMENEKRQFHLVGAHEFLGERADRVGVELRVGGREIDEVIRVRENGAELLALRMIEERRDLLLPERPREPLHVVLHEDLHCRAVD